MRFLSISIPGLLLVLASGCTVLVDNELESKPVPDAGFDTFCRGEVDGHDCSTPTQPNRVCVNLFCVDRRCGDAYVDNAAGEACDDGNTLANDGCENDCTITCLKNEDCDNANVCDGAEMCGLNNAGLPTCGPNPDVLIPVVGTPCSVGGGGDGGGGDGGVTLGMCNAEGVCQL